MRSIAYYCSHNGNNRYLATRIVRDLNCGIEEVKPRIDSLVLMLMRINIGNRELHTRVEDYDLDILCRPVWMGSLIVPLRNFIHKHTDRIRKIAFATCSSRS